MQHASDDHQPEFISLQQACRRIGISVQAAVKLPPEQGFPWLWLGNKRVVPRRRFDAWLARQLGEDAA
jgi:hypothetical protein